VFYLALSLTNIGALLEGESWGFVLEMARLVSLSAACVTLIATGLTSWSIWVALGWFALSASWLWRITRGVSLLPPSPPALT